MKNNLDLGQHFMVDNDLLDLIIEKSEIKTNEVVLEVGSGEGVLSKKILEQDPVELICVELDSRFKLSDDRITFIQGNILEEIQILFFDNLVANIPYHISEPLMIKLIQKRIKKITFVCGKKFSDILLGDSILGLIARSYYYISLEKEILPNSFNPPPKTNSALMTLRAKDSSEIFLTFYEHQKQKVKNYLLTISEGIKTKRELRVLFDSLKEILDMPLYMLNFEEYKTLYTFINKNLIR